MQGPGVNRDGSQGNDREPHLSDLRPGPARCAPFPSWAVSVNQVRHDCRMAEACPAPAHNGQCPGPHPRSTPPSSHLPRPLLSSHNVTFLTTIRLFPDTFRPWMSTKQCSELRADVGTENAVLDGEHLRYNRPRQRLYFLQSRLRPWVRGCRCRGFLSLECYHGKQSQQGRLHLPLLGRSDTCRVTGASWPGALSGEHRQGDSGEALPSFPPAASL